MTAGTEDRGSDSPYVERVWRSDENAPSRMLSVANSNWELVVSRVRGRVHVMVRGPETQPTTVDIPPETTAFGIVFTHGASMPHLAISRLIDTALVSPHTSRRMFLLRGDERRLPDFESAEDWIDELVRAGVLIRDPLVADLVAGERSRLDRRTEQRRVVNSTGLSQGMIRQIERARQAAILLGGGGVTPLEVVHRLGYYDQPHLARSLTRFVGRTATELRQAQSGEGLSLLYTTDVV